jgi:hypothetical protein
MSNDETNKQSSNRITRRAVLRSGATGALVAGGIGGVAGTAAAKTIVVDDNGNADYSSIQAAIDAGESGDTVVVRPGTYAEDVTVDESLTLRGRGNAVVQGTGGSTAAVSAATSGVTIERLRVENPGGLLGIKSQAGLSRVTIRNNRVSNVGPFGSLGVAGIISAAGQSGLSIVGNNVSSIQETASGVAAQGIYLDNEGGTSADAQIAGNSVSNVQSNSGAVGILIQVSGATVESNRVRGLSGTFAQGVNFDGNAGNTRLAVNTFERISGSQFSGEGIKIDGGNVGSLTITQNNLLPPVGLNNATETGVSAECNYWDAKSGPSPQGDGSKVAGPVDFTPWSISRIGGGGGNTCRGGQ